MMTLKKSRSRAGSAPLWALCLAFSILVLLHTHFTPIFEAPDEVWHYAYVRWLALGQGLPALDNDASGANQEVAQPPLYYLVASVISRPLSETELSALMQHNPGFGFQAPGTSADNKNMLIHDESTAWAWTGSIGAIRATRVTSWLFGLAAVLATWALGYEVTGSRRWALVTAALVTFQPQFVFMSAVVSNDSAATALATVALWLASRSLNRRPTPASALLSGSVAGLAILTKVSLLPIVALLGAALIWGALQGDGSSRPPIRPTRIMLIAGSYLATAAVVGGWWYLRNALQFGDPLAMVSHTDTPWGRAAPATLTQLLADMPLLARSFWGAYGWGHVLWPDAIYALLWTCALPLLAVAIGRLGRDWVAFYRRPSKQHDPLRTLGLAAPKLLPASLALLWLISIAAALIVWMRQVEAPHGRLLFPALGAWALLLTLGLREVTRIARPFGRGATTCLLSFCAILSTLAPGTRLAATFAPPRRTTPSEIVRACPHPIDLRYDGKAALLCAEVTPERVRPGDSATVRACWTGLAPMERDYTVFVHVIGPESSRVMERYTYPGLGRYPTSLWQPGGAFCDTYVGDIETWAPAPIRYQVQIGLLDTESGERLIPSTGDGTPLDPAVVGSISVVPDEHQETPDASRVDVAFDDGIRLIGYRAPEVALPGSTVTITLIWSPTATPTHDYVAFVHLWQPGDPMPLAQHDGRPREGWFPTLAWRAGDLIEDVHELTTPGNLESGTYPLWAGLYRPEDGERLPASDGQGRLLYDLVPLGSLQIEAH